LDHFTVPLATSAPTELAFTAPDNSTLKRDGDRSRLQCPSRHDHSNI
jgi:hypothetical protein